MDDQRKKDKEPNLILDDEKDILLDHEYDGIQELDNNMPPWWLYGFYFTIAFSVVYLLYYDVIGWGPSQEEKYEMEMAAAAERYGVPEEAETVNYADLEVLTDDVSLAAGRDIYLASRNLCATCHGAQAQGLVGPNLTNEYWKHGCDLESIIVSIKTGYPAQGMPPYGSTQSLNDNELHQLASYIISLRDSNPPNPKAPDMSRSVECAELEI